MNRTRKFNSGFTLTEIMIVVAIVGLLATLALPSLVRARASAANSRFTADLKVAVGAFQEYSIFEGDYPPDVTPSVVPNGMSSYLAKMKWTENNSLGGKWDWDYQQFGFKAGVSVYKPTANDEQMIRLDKMIDDGDLSSGTFQERTAGFISVIE